MGEMTREEFLEKAIVGAAAVALIPKSNLTATLEKMKGKDFIVNVLVKDGEVFGLGWEITGDEEVDIGAIRHLYRAAELQYRGEEI